MMVLIFLFFYLLCFCKIQPVDHGAYNFLLQIYWHKVSEKPGVNHPPNHILNDFLKKGPMPVPKTQSVE